VTVLARVGRHVARHSGAAAVPMMYSCPPPSCAVRVIATHCATASAVDSAAPERSVTASLRKPVAMVSQ